MEKKKNKKREKNPYKTNHVSKKSRKIVSDLGAGKGERAQELTKLWRKKKRKKSCLRNIQKLFHNILKPKLAQM